MSSVPGWWKQWNKGPKDVGKDLAKDLIDSTIKDSQATAITKEDTAPRPAATESGLIVADKHQTGSQAATPAAPPKAIDHATSATGVPKAVASSPASPVVSTPGQYKSSSPTPLPNTTSTKPYVAPAKPYVAQTTSVASTKKDPTITELTDSMKKIAFKLQGTVDDENMMLVLSEAEDALWDMWIEQENVKEEKKKAEEAEKAKKAEEAKATTPATTKPVEAPKASTPATTPSPSQPSQPSTPPVAHSYQQQQQRPQTPLPDGKPPTATKPPSQGPEDWNAAFAQYM